MFSKSAISLAIASFVFGTANLSAPTQVGQPRGFTQVNYSTCYEDPSGAECQKVQAGSQESQRGGAGMRDHRGAY